MGYLLGGIAAFFGLIVFVVWVERTQQMASINRGGTMIWPTCIASSDATPA